MGQFVVALRLKDKGRRVVLVRQLEAVLNDNEEIVEDGILKCPILKLTNTLEAIPSTSVIGSAALVHACSGTLCRIIDGVHHTRVERTDVNIQNKAVLQCDKVNHPYYLYNKFCYRQ